MSDAFALTTSAGPKAIVPGDFQSVWKMAELLQCSGLAPKDMKTQEQIAVAMLYGLEIGMTPMAAVQSIAVINGRPSLWGDGALALVRSNPICEYLKEWTEGEGTSAVAYCETKRKGGDVVKRSFSYQDAKDAQLLDKAGPWKQYRGRMMQMRARSWAIRDAFADLLRGFQIAEEQQDIEPKDITPGADAPLPPTPPAKAPARQVEGQIEGPKPDAAKAQAKKDADAAREASEKQEIEEKEAREAQQAEEREKRAAHNAREAERERLEAEQKRLHEEQSMKETHESEDHRDSQPDDGFTDDFRAYLGKLDRDMGVATNHDSARAAWEMRNRDFDTDEQIDAMRKVRDKHRSRIDALKEEAFDEFDYRQVFFERVAAATTPEALVALKEEAEAHVAAGRITQTRFDKEYEPALTTRIEAI